MLVGPGYGPLKYRDYETHFRSAQFNIFLHKVAKEYPQSRAVVMDIKEPSPLVKYVANLSPLQKNTEIFR